MKDQLLTEQEQARQLTRLEHRALAVLARHHQPDLERSPLPVGTLSQRHVQDMRLPVIQQQTRAGRQLDRLHRRA